MRFHVAREGTVMGEFEEQIFRNKVFSGEIRPSDFYWTAGFADWRPVSEFRVARKTEPILLDTGSAVPPAIRKARQRSAPANCPDLHMRTRIAHGCGDVGGKI